MCLACVSIQEDLPAVDEDVGARVEDKGEVRGGGEEDRPGRISIVFEILLLLS